MNTKKAGRYAAAGAALLAATLQLSTATAGASAPAIDIWVGGGPDDLSCQASGSACAVYGYVEDMTTPVTLAVDGKTFASGLPTLNTARGQFQGFWTPKAAGNYVLTAQQGALSQSVTVHIIDNNSLEALSQRIMNRLSSMSASHSQG